VGTLGVRKRTTQKYEELSKVGKTWKMFGSSKLHLREICLNVLTAALIVDSE
jgi:hypothetical protein